MKFNPLKVALFATTALVGLTLTSSIIANADTNPSSSQLSSSQPSSSQASSAQTTAPADAIINDSDSDEIAKEKAHAQAEQREIKELAKEQAQAEKQQSEQAKASSNHGFPKASRPETTVRANHSVAKVKSGRNGVTQNGFGQTSSVKPRTAGAGLSKLPQMGQQNTAEFLALGLAFIAVAITMLSWKFLDRKKK